MYVYIHLNSPEDPNDGKPEPLLDAVHLAQHQVDVDKDQHVAHHQLVRVLAIKSYHYGSLYQKYDYHLKCLSDIINIIKV